MCVSMVIAKTASGNVASKAAKLGESIFARQSDAWSCDDGKLSYTRAAVSYAGGNGRSRTIEAITSARSVTPWAADTGGPAPEPLSSNASVHLEKGRLDASSLTEKVAREYRLLDDRGVGVIGHRRGRLRVTKSIR